ncbi:MAG: GFA family protein [Pontixanthobacter sp.]
MTIHRGSCHCGAITIVLNDEPLDVGECNCSLCRRTGGLWHHCSPTLVEVTGTAKGYVQGDRMLTTWHCGTCGITTHWTMIDNPDYDRMGINLRLFEPEVWEKLPRRLIDGASF